MLQLGISQNCNYQLMDSEKDVFIEIRNQVVTELDNNQVI